jgi:hypothetical protein
MPRRRRADHHRTSVRVVNHSHGTPPLTPPLQHVCAASWRLPWTSHPPRDACNAASAPAPHIHHLIRTHRRLPDPLSSSFTLSRLRTPENPATCGPPHRHGRTRPAHGPHTARTRLTHGSHTARTRPEKHSEGSRRAARREARKACAKARARHRRRALSAAPSERGPWNHRAPSCSPGARRRPLAHAQPPAHARPPVRAPWLPRGEGRSLASGAAP